MYQFSQTSYNRLQTCDDLLQQIMEMALARSPVDFGIACGHRSVEEQQELYAQGRSTDGDIVTHVDGIQRKSKHNFHPSQAVDIYAWIGKASWDPKHLCVIAGVIMSCARELGIELRWGGNWDGDGIVISDQEFDDLPHFEI